MALALRAMNSQASGESLEVGVGSDSACSLQEAFLKYRRKKQEEAKQQRRASARAALAKPPRMDALRKKFLETAMTYIGVPYAKRYHDPSCPAYHSPLFLDCCGLVRRVLKDLKEDFGFTTGPWNQAYQFDTLPTALSGPEEMQPGDLVFVAGEYYKPKAKKQKHNMVHVEIWVGDGEKTLGARWQRGRIQVHDSYQYVSKSYRIVQYHFRSIDTWLSGVCRSFCPEHPWRRRRFGPSKRSVFAPDQDSEQCASGEQVQEEGRVSHCTSGEEGRVSHCASGEQVQEERRVSHCASGEQVQEEGRVRYRLEKSTMDSEEGECTSLGDESEACEGSVQLPLSSGESRQEPPGATPAEGETRPEGPPGSDPTPQPPGGRGGGPPREDPRPKPPTKIQPKPGAGARRCGRSYVICGGNAAPLVEAALESRGWHRLHDKSSTAFTLKWVELKQHIDYRSFREGEQLVNHFPNINLLTTKIGLLESLRAYDRMYLAQIHRHAVRMDSFVPTTYRMDVPAEREEFQRNYTDGELWICKPTGANRGKGIFLVRELQQLLDKLEADVRTCKMTARPTARIVQKYLSSPLLLDGRKFDIRVYLLVIAAQPHFLIFYHPGYIRLSCMAYDLSSADICVHLTNQYQQKKHPLYTEKKEDTIWDFSKLQSHLSQHHQLPDDWVASTLTRRMQAVMKTCFQSVQHKLEHRIGYFDLLGFDFMLDESLNVWLIEVNVNPAMHTACDPLRALLPGVVQETLDLAIEVFDKCRRIKPVLPLSSLRNFVPLKVAAP